MKKYIYSTVFLECVKLNLTRRQTVAVLGILAMALFSYTVVRAFILDITTDEAFSYLVYVRNGYLFPHEYNFMTANHHLLNVWGMWLSDSLFGTSEFALRIPALIAHLIYLFFTAKFSLKLKYPWVQIAGFLILNAHPYLLDFFSLARGYGLAWGMLAGSVYHASCYFADDLRRIYHLLWFAVFTALALLSSFVLIYYFAAAFVFVGVIHIIAKISFKRKLIGAVILTAIGVAATGIALPVIMAMKEAGALHWGAMSFGDMILSLGRSLWYNRLVVHDQELSGSPFILYASCLSIIILVVLCINLFRSNVSRQLLLLFLILVIAATCSGAVVQHLYNQSNYPAQRTAFFLFILFMFLVTGSVAIIPARLRGIILLLFLVPSTLIFCIRANFSYSLDWAYCEGVKDYISLLKTNHKPLSETRPAISLSVNNDYMACALFYKEQHGFSQLNIKQRLDLHPYPRSEYYLLNETTLQHLPTRAQLISINPFNNLSLYSDELLRRRETLLASNTFFASDRQHLSSQITCSREIMIVMPDSVEDSIATRFSFNGEILCATSKTDIYMFITVQNDTSTKYSGDYVPDIDQKQGLVSFGGTIIIPSRLCAGDKVKATINLTGGTDKPNLLGPISLYLTGYR